MGRAIALLMSVLLSAASCGGGGAEPCDRCDIASIGVNFDACMANCCELPPPACGSEDRIERCIDTCNGCGDGLRCTPLGPENEGRCVMPTGGVECGSD